MSWNPIDIIKQIANPVDQQINKGINGAIGLPDWLGNTADPVGYVNDGISPTGPTNSNNDPVASGIAKAAKDQWNQNQQALSQQQIQDQLKQKQLDLATGLENPHGLQQDMFNQFRTQRLQSLASDQSSARHALGSRGLLYGGISQGAQASNLVQAGNDLATAKGQIRTESQNQADQIRANVLDQSIKQMQTQQQLYDTIYNDALTQYNNERQAYQAVGAGVGAIAGTYFGPAGTAAGAVAGGAIAG